MALINGAQAIVSILAQYPKFDGGFAMVAAMAGAAITTAATIAKIASTKFESGGTSVDAPNTSGLTDSGGTANTPTGNANQDTTTSTADLVNEETGPTKIFVSAVDISNVQSTSKKIDTIGTVGE